MQDNTFIVNPTYITAGAIAVYENAWESPNKTINSIVNISKDTSLGIKFSPSKTYGDPKDNNEQSIRTSYGLSISENSEVSEIINLIDKRCYELISSTVKNYRKLFKIEQEIKDIRKYRLLRYSVGEKYDRHYDGGTESGRSISVLIYLNDDYEGGEIEFPNFEIKIKPKAGMMILFPSNYAYAHIAHPVKSGEKYAIVTWLKDR
jgi:hypothetical protein